MRFTIATKRGRREINDAVRVGWFIVGHRSERHGSDFYDFWVLTHALTGLGIGQEYVSLDRAMVAARTLNEMPVPWHFKQAKRLAAAIPSAMKAKIKAL